MSLTPFSQMLYDATSPQYSYPTPATETPSPEASDPHPVSLKKKSPPKPKTQGIDRAVTNNIAHEENSSITVQVPAKAKKPKLQSAKPQEVMPARKSSGIAVVIPSYNPENHISSQPMIHAASPAILPKSKKAAQPPASTSVSLNPQPQPHTPAAQRPLQPTAPVSDSKSKIAVIIPGPSMAFRSEEYEVLPDSPETPQHLSRKRKRSEGGSEDDLSIGLDQREKADLALRSLQDQFRDIFEAEDPLVSISAATQTKVESSLQKVITVGRFSQIPLDDLIRLQRLSEGALKDAETIDLKVEETMGESEVEAWLLNVLVADLGLKAARTTLRMMSGGREDKQLYSEDATQAALNAFKNAMESCLIPIVEMRSSGSTANLFKLLSAQKKVITNLLTQCRRLLSLFATLVTSIELSETVVNTLEFTASRLIFVENAHAEKDSVIGIAKFDSLRVVATVCICTFL
jgi:cohesin loading factor subunit SCC2